MKISYSNIFNIIELDFLTSTELFLLHLECRVIVKFVVVLILVCIFKLCKSLVNWLQTVKGKGM